MTYTANTMEKLRRLSVGSDVLPLHHTSKPNLLPRPCRIVCIYLLASFTLIWLLKSLTYFHLHNHREPLIQSNVWQLYTTSGPPDPKLPHKDAIKTTKIDATAIRSWLPVDGNWTYHYLSTSSGESFVRTHFAHQPAIIKVYTALSLPVMKSDFLRYLVLAGAGGVYADNDVEMIKPLQHWVPVEYRNVTRAVVGIERDTASAKELGGWSFRFVQHTLAMARGHPIMVDMARDITARMLAMERQNGTRIEELALHDVDVVEITGPRRFKDIVFEHLSRQVGWSVGWRNVSSITAPVLFGDTLILPVNYFAAGQQHSGSVEKPPERLVQHYWRGTWRHRNEPLL